MSNVPPPECVTTRGVLADQVVGVYAIDNDRQIVLAEHALRETIRGLFAQQGENTPFRVWHERALITGPDGGLVANSKEAMGWRLCVSIPDTAPLIAKAVLDHLSSFVGGFQVHTAPWSEAG